MVIGRVDQVKGETIISELNFVKYKKGLAGLQPILDDLNRDRPSNLKIGPMDFDPKEWYPVQTQLNVLRSITEHYGEGDPDIIRSVGAFGIQKITQFTFIIRFMNVKKVANKMAETIQTLYRTTELKVIDRGEKEIEVTVRGFPHDPVYMKLLQGGIEQLLIYLHVEPFSVKATMDDPEGDIGTCRYVLNWS